MNLIEIIKAYVSQSETDFAILINGCWGSGKTYFVNHDIKNEINKIACTHYGSNEKHYELIYVSLYGVTSTEELEKRLFLEINPLLKSKVGKFTTTLVSKGLQYIGLDVDKNDQKEIMNIFGGIPKNKVLVFDDLERLETSTLNEVFGFINSYTEHQNLKVIIVADEDQLSENFSNYPKIKEKLVRFAYLYTPNLKHVFPSFVKKYHSCRFLRMLTHHSCLC